MGSSARRPIAVLIALAILALYIALFVFVFFVGPPDASVLDEPEFVDIVIDKIEIVAEVLSFMVAFWALATRRQWGRWFIAAPLAYIAGTIGYGLFAFPYLNPDVQADMFIVMVIFVTPLMLAILLASFGARVKTYFSCTEQSGSPN